jgi:hypothetical protein
MRQVLREYGTQIARLLGIPTQKVKLVKEGDSSRGRNLAMTAASMLSGAMGDSGKAQIYADLLATMKAQDAVQTQLDAAGSNAMEQAQRDPLLGHAFNVDGLAKEIDALLQLQAGEGRVKSVRLLRPLKARSRIAKRSGTGAE